MIRIKLIYIGAVLALVMLGCANKPKQDMGGSAPETTNESSEPMMSPNSGEMDAPEEPANTPEDEPAMEMDEPTEDSGDEGGMGLEE